MSSGSPCLQSSPQCPPLPARTAAVPMPLAASDPCLRIWEGVRVWGWEGVVGDEVVALIT